MQHTWEMAGEPPWNCAVQDSVTSWNCATNWTEQRQEGVYEPMAITTSMQS